jgi:hypothetical protein
VAVSLFFLTTQRRPFEREQVGVGSDGPQVANGAIEVTFDETAFASISDVEEALTKIRDAIKHKVPRPVPPPPP